MHAGWLTCSSGSTALSCNQTAGFYLSGGACLVCNAVHPYLLTCSSPSAHITCRNDYYNNAGTCTLCTTINPTWLTCADANNAISCAYGYFLNSTNKCEACSAVNSYA